jgi:LacI family transcriptional regulator
VTTISDVARRAGVGLATVSRVLNGSGAVRAETRERVLAAMEELGYVPSAAARALSRKRTDAIGVLMGPWADPATAERWRGVMERLAATTYDVVVFNPVHAGPPGPLLSRQRTDGLLVVGSALAPSEERRLSQADLVAVVVGAAAREHPCIVSDEVAAGRMATEHLIGLGHRRIAFVGPASAEGWTAGEDRRRGYEAALAAAGVPADDGLVRLGAQGRGGARAVGRERLGAADRPSAVLAASDDLALGVLAAATGLGLGEPGGVSVVGVDDIELAGFAGLTTVRLPLRRSGQLAVERLLQMLDGGAREVDRTELPVELVVRASTGPPARRA